jgi:uncharacterized membrane protein
MKTTRYVVYTAIIGALYFVFVVGLAPISFHVLQFRAANVLKALAVCRPEFAFGFALGDFFANQASPFGALDWLVMPFFDIGGALSAYKLRRRKWVAVTAQSMVIAVGVATFPLGLGARLPWVFSFLSVFASSLLVIGIGTAFLLPAYNAVFASEKRT